MGSGVLLAALVVLWFVVLVPMVVTRGDATSGRGEVASSGRTLQRRRAVDPVLSAETERVAIDREQLRSSGELQVDVHAIRRRTLGALVALALLAAGAGALVSPWAWPAQGLLDLAAGAGAGAAGLGGGGLRAGAAQGRPPGAAGRPPGRPRRSPRVAAGRRRPP